jgi:hypothetical protein
MGTTRPPTRAEMTRKREEISEQLIAAERRLDSSEGMMMLAKRRLAESRRRVELAKLVVARLRSARNGYKSK